ncbi:hypothetical protein BD626DRAFT_360031, partial [Schizophyllum amplum]
SCHDDVSLQEMDDALEMWEKNRQYFIITNARNPRHFNIPKIHSLKHYASSIRLLGTTDNYNTETFERLHIDFAKRGWRASNKRDAFPQMITWLERQEKISGFERFIKATVSSAPTATVIQRSRRNAATSGTLSIAKHPNKTVKLTTLETSHDIPGLSTRIKEFLNPFSIQPVPSRQLRTFSLPFDKID